MKKSPLSCLPRTAVAYARYSSAGQRDVSIEQQLEDIRAYAERDGYTIVHEYADHARSGYKNVTARSEFQAMIAAASSGTFDTVLVWKVDRFGRSRRDSAVYKDQLRSLGVRVVSTMEHIPEGAAGVITEGMLETLAEWYSRNLSENVCRGMTDNAKKCLYNGAHIYGYSCGPDRHYVINEPEARVVRQVFKYYAEGFSMTEITRFLNDSGVRTNKGKLFTLGMIYNILKQERYLGIYIWKEYRTPGGMPAIIDHQIWNEAQRMRKKTGRHYEKSPVEYLLTGKAFCGMCGCPLVGDSGTSHTGTTHYYYTCQSRKRRTGCHKKPIRREALEDLVINFLLDHCLTGEEIEKIADAVVAAQQEKQKSSPLESMRGELRSTLRKIDNINNAIAEGIWTDSTVVTLRSLEQTAKDLRNSISYLEFTEGELIDRDRVIFWLGKFRDRDRTDLIDRRDLVRTFLNSVYVYDDRLVININAVEGDLILPLADLPDPPPCSDNITSGLLKHIHPNLMVISYQIAM